MLLFSPTVSISCFNITIIDDDRYEVIENFFVVLYTSDSQTDLFPQNTLVNILDNDGKH